MVIGVEAKFILTLLWFVLLPQNLQAGSIELGTTVPFSNSKKKTCDVKQFSDAMLFISDYLGCLSGEDDKCISISDYINLGLNATGAASSYFPSKYAASRILSMSNFSAGDAARKAADRSYQSTLSKQMGGNKIDALIARHGGDLKKALQSIEKRLVEYDPEDLRHKPKSGFTSEQIPRASRSLFEELHAQETQLERRMSIYSSNDDLMKKVAETTTKVNSIRVANIDMIDQKLTELDARLVRSGRNGQESALIKRQIADLEALKNSHFSNLAVTETQVKEIAEAFNKSLDAEIEKLRSVADSKSPGTISQRTRDSIGALEKLKLRIPPHALNTYSRLVLDVSKRGYSLIDLSGKWSKLPTWAKDLRISEFRELPNIIRKVMSEYPNLEQDYDAFITKIAEAEHERYRTYTEKRLIRVYNAEQEFLSEKNIPKLTPRTDSEFTTIKVHSTQDLSALSKVAQTRGKALTEAERKALNTIKPNWLEVDRPFAQLSDHYKELTEDGVAKEIDTIIVNFTKDKSVGKVNKQFLLRPMIGKLAGKATRFGLGWGGTAAFVAYDWNDYTELALTGLFKSTYIRNNFWDKIDPSCRLPEQKKLGAVDPIKKVSRYFCECKTDETPFDKLPEMCRVAPSEIDAKTKKYCDLARSPGRDHDLYIAKAYQELGDKDQQYRQLLKQSVGCDVMKNQPSNCRFTTNEVTGQGLYYLALIQENKLFQPVAELCPDVCQHWVDVANKKMNELKEMKQINNLPQVKKDNSAKEVCSDSAVTNPPPTSPSKVREWQNCQPPVICKSSRHIRVNINPRSRYEVEIDPYTMQIKNITHHFLHDIGANEMEDATGIGKSWSFRTDDLKTFKYTFDEDGKIENLTTYDFDRDNNVDKIIPPHDLESYFSDDAYNTNSNRKILIENYSTAKRLEMFISVRKALEYCCKNEINCENKLNTEPPPDDLPTVDEGAK